jgi:hypothetical protein
MKQLLGEGQRNKTDQTQFRRPGDSRAIPTFMTT